MLRVSHERRPKLRRLHRVQACLEPIQEVGHRQFPLAISSGTHWSLTLALPSGDILLPRQSGHLTRKIVPMLPAGLKTILSSSASARRSPTGYPQRFGLGTSRSSETRGRNAIWRHESRMLPRLPQDVGAHGGSVSSRYRRAFLPDVPANLRIARATAGVIYSAPHPGNTLS